MNYVLGEYKCPYSLREKCPYSELFWSVFSRIPKMRTRITPNTDTFYAVIPSENAFLKAF